jgi:HTH-type transcriptional regulator/antitoxin HigA
MNKYIQDKYNPDFIPHPGLTLAETLEVLGMTQAELAKRISRPEPTISEIINGTKSITPGTSIQLERALGVPSSFWNNLETNYQELKAKKASKKSLSTQIDYVKQYPYSQMAKLGWIESTRVLEDRVENLLKFFGVDSLSLVENIIPVSYRKHNGKNISSHSIRAWLRKGEIDTREIATQDFDRELLLLVLVISL